MIRAENFVVDGRSLDAVAPAVGDQEIVDAPADVLLARVEAIAPPRILHRVRVEMAERIGKARIQQLVEFSALFV